MQTRLVLLFAAAASGLAQPPADFEKSVRAAMAPALAEQRASIHRQAASLSRPGAPSPVSFFFTPSILRGGTLADCDPLPAGTLNPLIETAARETGVNPQLVRAVIDKESAGRPCAVSFRGAEGLMQLMPATAEQFDVRDPFDPRQNVQAGTRLLRLLLDRYDDDPALALGAYNAGAGRVDQERAVPAIPETLDYVADILSRLNPQGARTAAPKPQD